MKFLLGKERTKQHGLIVAARRVMKHQQSGAFSTIDILYSPLLRLSDFTFRIQRGKFVRAPRGKPCQDEAGHEQGEDTKRKLLFRVCEAAGHREHLMSSRRILARKRRRRAHFLQKIWGHTDSNREPSSYEPPALTVELCPRSMNLSAFLFSREIFFPTSLLGLEKTRRQPIPTPSASGYARSENRPRNKRADQKRQRGPGEQCQHILIRLVGRRPPRKSEPRSY